MVPIVACNKSAPSTPKVLGLLDSTSKEFTVSDVPNEDWVKVRVILLDLS